MIFLHGTASSTHGSFGELWSAGRAGTLEGLRKPVRRQRARVRASLDDGGTDREALELARELDRRLSDGVEIDLISHSRGGLIGELLCRVNVPEGAPPFDADDIRLAGSAEWLETATDLGDSRSQGGGRGAREGGRRTPQAPRRPRPSEGTRNPGAAFRSRGLPGARHDACIPPPRQVGTDPPERRVARRQGEPDRGAGRSLGDLLAVLIQQKTRPEVLPGLAAMLPDAGLLRAVNNPTRPVGGDLAVIAGDLEADSIWRRLLDPDRR